MADAIPLFHQRLQSHVLETAFDMIESCHLPETDGLEIIGVYESVQPGSLSDGREQSAVAQYIASMVESRWGNGSLFVCLKDATVFNDDESEAVSLEKNTTGLIVKHFEIKSTGSIASLPEQ